MRVLNVIFVVFGSILRKKGGGQFIVRFNVLLDSVIFRHYLLIFMKQGVKLFVLGFFFVVYTFITETMLLFEI